MSAVPLSLVTHLPGGVASGVLPEPNSAFGGLGPVQIVALVLCFVIPLIGWALLFRQVSRFVQHYRLVAWQQAGAGVGDECRVIQPIREPRGCVVTPGNHLRDSAPRFEK